MSTAANDEQIPVLPELSEGQELHLLLQLANLSESSSESRLSPGAIALTCTVAQAFRPFTMSPVLLVSLAEPSASAPSLPSLPSQAILKLFDRRCLSNIREKHDDDKPWSLDKERELRKYLAAVAAGTIEPSGDFDDPLYLWGEEELSDGEFEAYLQHQAKKDFDIERKAYERLRSLQGTKIPRVYGTVKYEVNIALSALPDGDPSESLMAMSTREEIVPGLLLEYIPSLTLRQFVVGWTARDPPLPGAVLAALCDEVVRVVDRVSDFDVLNEDVHMDNFLIREPFVIATPATQLGLGGAGDASSSSGRGEEPSDSERTEGTGEGGDARATVAIIEDPVVLIDLAQCRLRKPVESEKDWYKAKAMEDEEGAAGTVLCLFLVEKFVGKGVWTYKGSGRYVLTEKDLFHGEGCGSNDVVDEEVVAQEVA